MRNDKIRDLNGIFLEISLITAPTDIDRTLRFLNNRALSQIDAATDLSKI